MDKRTILISEAISEGMLLASLLNEDKQETQVPTNPKKLSKSLFPESGVVFPTLNTKTDVESVKNFVEKWNQLASKFNDDIKGAVELAKQLRVAIKNEKDKTKKKDLKNTFKDTRKVLNKMYSGAEPIFKELKTLRKQILKDLKKDENVDINVIKNELKKVDEVESTIKDALAAKTLYDKIVEKVKEWIDKALELFTDKDKAYLKIGIGALVALGSYLILYGIARKVDSSNATFNPFKLLAWGIKTVFTGKVRKSVRASIFLLVILFVISVLVVGVGSFNKIYDWFMKKKNEKGGSQAQEGETETK